MTARKSKKSSAKKQREEDALESLREEEKASLDVPVHTRQTLHERFGMMVPEPVVHTGPRVPLHERMGMVLAGTASTEDPSRAPSVPLHERVGLVAAGAPEEPEDNSPRVPLHERVGIPAKVDDAESQAPEVALHERLGIAVAPPPPPFSPKVRRRGRTAANLTPGATEGS